MHINKLLHVKAFVANAKLIFFLLYEILFYDQFSAIRHMALKFNYFTSIIVYPITMKDKINK